MSRTAIITDPARPLFAPSREQIAAFQRDGYVVLPGVVRVDARSALREEILQVLRVRNQPDSFLAQTGEYLAGSALDAWINSPTLRGAAEAFMGPTAHVYLPFTAVKGVGMGAFTFHQDNNYTLLEGPALNCWTAFDAMSPANGCLRIVPGSHRTGTVASTASEDCPGHRRTAAVPTEWTEVIMEPGDVCVFDRLTVHGSGPNGSDRPRVAYAVQFHRHDTRAFFDDAWAPLLERPRYQNRPVARLTDLASRGE